ncbi:MAG: TetR family transcriptional regulator [Comamonadaceae bacterium CG_4_9_14_3_um_filter_60_33]|nr:MAG: TetR family transcriptional regulator [Comamonadaceae bacterium CG2_30_59_20]PJB47010.1 MAG: TetR family transcriptional regulator [Comamonadaceae bacterium CG_4_9_14_3_um_filter_60_33]
MEVQDKPTKQRTEVRQASLVEAALLLAAQRSPADITTADLARAVGISQGAVFKHFASKEAIWLAVLDWVAETLMARLQAAAAGAEPTALPALRAVFMAHVDFITCYPGVPRLIFQELQHSGDTPLKGSVRMLMQRYRTLLMQLLQQAVQQRTLAKGTNLQAAAVLFIGAVQGLMMQAMISGDLPAMARQAPEVFAIFTQGLFENRPAFESPSF